MERDQTRIGSGQRKLKIALFGYGTMGKLIEKMAKEQGHDIVAKISRQNSIDSLANVDVCIDFSHASCVMDHVSFCVKHQINLIIGTTGWENQLEEVRKKVEKSSIGCLYAPNFSLGVHLFIQIVSYAASLINRVEGYDVSGVEYHHKNKVDKPSGTAKALTQQLLKQLKQFDTIPFESVRCGSIPGTHTLLFDSPSDTIVLTHQARNKDDFAKGALRAAEWMMDKKGFFTLDDMLPNVL